jgi:hypothetical protein
VDALAVPQPVTSKAVATTPAAVKVAAFFLTSDPPLGSCSLVSDVFRQEPRASLALRRVRHRMHAQRPNRGGIYVCSHTVFTYRLKSNSYLKFLNMCNSSVKPVEAPLHQQVVPLSLDN